MKQKEQNHRSLLRCVTLAVLLLVVMWVPPTLTVRAQDLSGITDEAEERGLDLNGRRYFIDFAPHGSDKSSFMLNLDAHCEITICFWSNYYSGSGTAGLEISTQDGEVRYSKTGIQKGTVFIPLDLEAGKYNLKVFMENESVDSRVTLELYRDVDVIDGRVGVSELRHTAEDKKLYLKGETTLVLDRDLVCNGIESLADGRAILTLTGEGTLRLAKGINHPTIIMSGVLYAPSVFSLTVKGGTVNIVNDHETGSMESTDSRTGIVKYCKMYAGTLNVTTNADGIGEGFKMYGGKLMVDAQGFGVKAASRSSDSFPKFYGGRTVIRGKEGAVRVNQIIVHGENSGDNLGIWDEYKEAAAYISPDMRVISPETGFSKTGRGDYVFAATVKELELNGPLAGEWKKNQTGYWYEFFDDTYLKKCWREIEGSWYYFSENGYMKTGWLKENDKWYYLNPSGKMKSGWLKDNGKWYYLTASGAMKTGWVKDKGKWYYLDSSGAMISDCSRKINGKVYRFNGSGVCMNP